MDRKLTVIVSALLLSTAPLAAQPEWTDEGRLKDLEKIADAEKKLWVPMRDGVRLSTDVYRPKDASGPLPTIFWRTPYDYNTLRGGRVRFVHEAVRHGYALVLQNERGKFFSEGEWEILGRPRTDGVDALDWIAEQPWSNGKVGTVGCSSSAEWQLALAAMDHPAHAAMVPMASGAGIGRVGPYWEQGNWYRGGVFQMLFAPWLYGNQNTQRPTFPGDLPNEDLMRLSKYFDLVPEMPEKDWMKLLSHLPLTEVIEEAEGPKGIYSQFIARTPTDPAWLEGGLYHDDEDWGVPALWFNSWYDVSIGPNLALYEHVRTQASDAEVRDNQFLVVGPNLHCRFWELEDEMEVGERVMENVDFSTEELIFDWFDHWLKGEENGVTEQTPRVQYYAMGAAEWRSAETWPPAGAESMTLYLDGDGAANSLYGDGALVRSAPSSAAVDRFVYDPMNPVLSRGGGLCCLGSAVEPGVFDQRPVEARHDVLVYTSEPLAEPLDVTGGIEMVLYVSSDARDTDFTAKLVDVAPDGTAYNIDETILRARYREGFDRQVMMEEGEVYELRFTPMATSNVFEAGHRIRLEVSSSNFPRFARNLNTGGANHDESEPVVAHNAVHHGPEHPSRLELTVVP